MKKTNLLSVQIMVFACLTLLSGFTAIAQITLTQNNLPQIGDTWILATDTAPTVTAGNAGANQTWNLSAINATLVDTEYFVSTASTPYASNFPGANIAWVTPFGADTEFEYINSGAGSLGFVGNYVLEAGFGFVQTNNNPSITELSLPATYLSSWTSTATQVLKTFVQQGNDSAEQIIGATQYDTVDGWGMVTTPAGSFNALRVKSIIRQTYDSIFTYSTMSHSWVFTYANPGLINAETLNWYADNGTGSLVASVSLDSIGAAVNNASYLVGTGAAGIQQASANSKVKVYPNPASSVVNFVCQPGANQNMNIKVMDLEGRETEYSLSSNGRLELNTMGYASGMYLYMITDMQGNQVDKGKFCISH